MKIQFDEGYAFGLGAFETIAVEERKPIFLEKHLERLETALQFLGISRRVSKQEIYDWLNKQNLGKKAMKIIISEKNTTFTIRENPYTEEKLRMGFSVGISEVRRNETSPLTFHKTLNYGDAILEKRAALQSGMDERILLNTKGYLAECTSSNLFWVLEGELRTPAVSCGILPGIMRGFILNNHVVKEGHFFPSELDEAEEIFVTNSLMGIMPVTQYGERKLGIGKTTKDCMKKYQEVLKKI